MDELRYGDLVRIGWFLLWRGVGSFLILLIIVNQVVLFLNPGLTRTEPSLWAFLLPLLITVLLSLCVVMPLVARALLRKRFARFELRLIGLPIP